MTLRRRRDGFALLVVLWFLVLFATVGTWLLANAHVESERARNLLAGARAEGLADAGVARAAFIEMDPDLSKRWKLDGKVHRLRVPGGALVIRLTDETEKINVNLASAELIAAIFKATGADAARADGMGAAIYTWVHGADGGDDDQASEPYRDAGLSYGPPSAPFESLDDLGRVLGLAPKDLTAALPYLTIYTSAGRPNGTDAPKPVSAALVLAPDPNAPASEEADDPNSGQQPIDASTTSTDDGGGTDETPAAANQQQSDQTGEVVIAIDVLAEGDDGGAFARHAVIRLDPGTDSGYVVLDWQRRDAAE